MNKDYGLDKKITLELTKDYKKNYKIASLFLSIISAMLILICIFVKFNIAEKIIIYSLTIVSIISAIYCALIINVKLEIDHGTIAKYNCFKRKKIIGNLSDIIYFTTSDNDAIVYKENYKKMFTFKYTISKIHKSFYKYLLDNHNDIIPIFKNKFSCITTSAIIVFLVVITFWLLFSIEKYLLVLCIFIPVPLFIYYSWLSKQCLIIDDKKITYYGLIKTKEINLSDITKIKFRINRYRYRQNRMISSSYHDIFIYNKRNLLLKVPRTNYEDINRIVDKTKQYNIKIVRR